MGLSSSKTKTTTTPTNPQFTTDAVQAQTDAYKNFMALDPQSLVAGPSALQQKAFADVQNLGGWEKGLKSASSMAGQAGNAGANTFGGVTLGPADQVGPIATVQGESLLDNLQSYIDPGLDAYVNNSLSAYDDQSGRSRAAMAAQAAKAGAFGGSRYGIAQSQFETDTDMKRALTESQLRADAYKTGAQLSADDANRRQGAGLFNAGAENQRSIVNTGFNNDFKLAQGGFDQQTGMFNAQQKEAQLARKLQAAGLSADIANAVAANSRADTALTAELGNIQQQIAQAQAYAPAQQLLIGSQSLGATPYNLFTGSNSTTKSSPGIGGILGGVIGAGLSGWATGGFK